MAVPEEEVKKQVAAGEEGPGPYRGFDPFMQYLLQRLDSMEANLRREIREEIGGLRQEINARIDGLHQEVHGGNRWAIATIITVIVGLGGVIASLLAVLAKLP